MKCISMPQELKLGKLALALMLAKMEDLPEHLRDCSIAIKIARAHVEGDKFACCLRLASN